MRGKNSFVRIVVRKVREYGLVGKMREYDRKRSY